MYEIILADPPWEYKTWSDKGKGRSAEQHYNVMSLHDIKALPVKDIAAPDCALFMWCINSLLPEALDVIKSWDFTYKTVAFVYVKKNKSGGLFTGMGYYSRQNIELCLLATRGKPKRESRSVHQVILAPRLKHSQKPTEIHKRIVELMGNKRRIELFAREKVDGWNCLGYEITGNDILVDLKNIS